MLSLESPGLQKPVQDHIRALNALGTDSPDVVGYAVAVNGKLSSADLYATNDMFRKQWAKLPRSSALEAIADRGAGTPPPPLLSTPSAPSWPGRIRGTHPSAT